MNAIPTSGDISAHPPYRAIVGFCIIEGYQIADSIIELCNLWREGIMRIVIEKARPLLLEVY